MKGKENSQTICWRIEKHGFRQGSKAGRGNKWEVLRFRVGGVDSEVRAPLRRGMLLEQTAAEEDLSAPGLSMTAGSKSVLISVN